MTPEEQAALDAEKAKKNVDSGSDQGSALAILAKKNAELERDNKDYRAKNKVLREEAADAKATATVKPEDASDLVAYRALGKPEDLRGLADFKVGVQRERDITDVAAKATIDGKPLSAKVLAALAGDLQFSVETKSTNGKEATTVSVKHAGPDGKEALTPIDAYARANWAEFLPSLAPGASATPEGGTTTMPNRGTPPRFSQHPNFTPPPANAQTGNPAGYLDKQLAGARAML